GHLPDVQPARALYLSPGAARARGGRAVEALSARAGAGGRHRAGPGDGPVRAVAAAADTATGRPGPARGDLQPALLRAARAPAGTPGRRDPARPRGAAGVARSESVGPAGRGWLVHCQ